MRSISSRMKSERKGFITLPPLLDAQAESDRLKSIAEHKEEIRIEKQRQKRVDERTKAILEWKNPEGDYIDLRRHDEK